MHYDGKPATPISVAIIAKNEEENLKRLFQILLDSLKKSYLFIMTTMMIP